MNARARAVAIDQAESDRDDIEAAFVMFRMGLDRLAHVVDDEIVVALAAAFHDAAGDAAIDLERKLDASGASRAVEVNLRDERAQWKQICEGGLR